MAREEWTLGQRAIRERLLPLLPQRPWWVIVRPPGAKPPECCAGSPIMRWDHTTWRSHLPPCARGCCCTVWALTPAEARRINARRAARQD